MVRSRYLFSFNEISMDRIDAMNVFVTVVETRSLSAASRKLRMPLPTVSRKVSDLEAHLKARLLNRSTRQLTLTDAGSAYLTACRRILDDVSEAERAATGEYNAPKGDLMISAPLAFGRIHLLPIVNEFLREYAQVDVRLVLGDRIDNLMQEHLDLAVRIGDLADSTLVATRVGATRRVVCASPDYFARHAAPKTPQDLQSHACIAFDAMGSTQEWVFKDGKASVTASLQPRLIVNTAEAAIDAAVAGVGITRVLSYQVQSALQQGTLVKHLSKFEPDAMPINLLFTAQRRVPLKLRSFLDFAAPLFRVRLQSLA
jgi:DNA-binding transcriptional LysR family regulator